jgi:hypothetical protein
VGRGGQGVTLCQTQGDLLGTSRPMLHSLFLFHSRQARTSEAKGGGAAHPAGSFCARLRWTAITFSNTCTVILAGR